MLAEIYLVPAVHMLEKEVDCEQLHIVQPYGDRPNNKKTIQQMDKPQGRIVLFGYVSMSLALINKLPAQRLAYKGVRGYPCWRSYSVPPLGHGVPGSSMYKLSGLSLICTKMT